MSITIEIKESNDRTWKKKRKYEKKKTYGFDKGRVGRRIKQNG